MKKLPRCKMWFYHAEAWKVYPLGIAENDLIQGKGGVVSLERNNGRRRHWFARFRSKSMPEPIDSDSKSNVPFDLRVAYGGQSPFAPTKSAVWASVYTGAVPIPDKIMANLNWHWNNLTISADKTDTTVRSSMGYYN